MERFSGIRLFYDGTNIEKYGRPNWIDGFTTNTSFMAQAGKTNYPEFYAANKEILAGRCISLQVFSEYDSDIFADALKINAYGPNIYVKIPIVKSTGESNTDVIVELLQKGIQVNVTAVFSPHQVVALYHQMNKLAIQTPTIVSVFADRISDTCVDPCHIVKFIATLFKPLSQVEILWAGCMETLSIQNAMDSGCHIITIPDSILDRIGRTGKDLVEFSIETVKGFNKDGRDARIIL